MSNDIMKAFFASASVAKPPIYSLSQEAMEKILEMLDEKDQRIVELESALGVLLDHVDTMPNPHENPMRHYYNQMASWQEDAREVLHQ